MSKHPAADIADKVPADYDASNMAAYITALAGRKAGFTIDGLMPATGAQTVNTIETKYVPLVKGTSVD